MQTDRRSNVRNREERLAAPFRWLNAIQCWTNFGNQFRGLSRHLSPSVRCLLRARICL